MLWPIIASGVMPHDISRLASAYSVANSVGNASDGASRRLLAAAWSAPVPVPVPAGRRVHQRQQVDPGRSLHVRGALIDDRPVARLVLVELGPHPSVLGAAAREHEDDGGRASHGAVGENPRGGALGERSRDILPVAADHNPPVGEGLAAEGQRVGDVSERWRRPLRPEGRGQVLGGLLERSRALRRQQHELGRAGGRGR